jgi:hypothetical protein
VLACFYPPFICKEKHKRIISAAFAVTPCKTRYEVTQMTRFEAKQKRPHPNKGRRLRGTTLINDSVVNRSLNN